MPVRATTLDLVSEILAAMTKPSLFSPPLLGALVFGCAAVSPAPPGAEMFEIHEIATGTARHQTVLTGSFGTGAALAVVNMDENGRQRVQFHGFDGDDWSRVLEAPLGTGALFADVVRGTDRDRLVAYRHGRVEWFDPESATVHVLAELSTTYRAPDDGGVPQIDITRDLNGDGLDDLLVPDIDGFRVAVQSPDGSFAAPVKLGPPEPFLEARAYGDTRTYQEAGITPENIPWYLARVHELDYDRDGLSDLAFWNGDRFDVYPQTETGTFQTTPDTFEIDVAFDFDGAYALAFDVGDASPVSLLLGLGENAEHRVLKGFRDLDADGVADLITLTLSGPSPLRLRGRFEIHFGQAVTNGTVFAATPDTTVDVPGRSAGGEPWGYASHGFIDFDSDGDIDMALGAVDTRAGGMLRAIAGNAISIDLAFYRLRDRAYPDRPDATRRVASAFRPLSRRGPLFPTVLTGDVDGDGQMDLLIGDHWDRLSVFLATSGPDPFPGPAVKVSVDIPADGHRNARLADLNGDGRQDVVIHHPSSTGPNRVVVLMAR